MHVYSHCDRVGRTNKIPRYEYGGLAQFFGIWMVNLRLDLMPKTCGVTPSSRFRDPFVIRYLCRNASQPQVTFVPATQTGAVTRQVAGSMITNRRTE